MTKSYHVKVDGFEGPLDLLLHLVNRYEIDIYNIPVAKITDQYMHFIQTMQQLELDVASEYLVMAATLLAMKSQMLLPNPTFEDLEEEESEEDPRQELMERLQEYRKYKLAAQDLKEKEVDANRIYTRPSMNLDQFAEKSKKVDEAEASIYEMIQAMGNVMKRVKNQKPRETKIQRDEIPIQMRMDEILNQISSDTNGTPFTGLFDQLTRPHIVVTFMALLELMKSNDIVCVQANHFDELIVYRNQK